MQLIENYLYEVGHYLPAEQRSDIVSELRSQLEDEVQEEAGHSPSREQIERVLNRYGHPINVASGYREPRFLIGPELYPAFIETLSTVFILSLVAFVSIQLLTWVTTGWSTGLRNLSHMLFSVSLWITGLTVICFAAMEHYGERVGWYDNWKASSLSDQTPISFNRSDVITNLFTEGVFLLWWNGVLMLQNWIPGSGERFSIGLAESWSLLYWPVNAVVGTWFLVHAFTLIRRRWTRPTLALELGLGVLGIVTCLYLIVQPDLIIVTGDVEGVKLIDRSIRVTLLVIIGVIVWDIWEAYRRWKLPL